MLSNILEKLTPAVMGNQAIAMNASDDRRRKQIEKLDSEISDLTAKQRHLLADLNKALLPDPNDRNPRLNRNAAEPIENKLADIENEIALRRATIDALQEADRAAIDEEELRDRLEKLQNLEDAAERRLKAARAMDRAAKAFAQANAEFMEASSEFRDRAHVCGTPRSGTVIIDGAKSQDLVQVKTRELGVHWARPAAALYSEASPTIEEQVREANDHIVAGRKAELEARNG